MKKEGKVTKPFRYDLNQIFYDSTMQVKNRFKGLNSIDRVPEELWTEVHNNIVQEVVIKTVPKKKKSKRTKWLSEEALQRAEKRKVKGKGEKERYTSLNAEFQRPARRNNKAFLSDQCKQNKYRKATEWKWLEISSRKSQIPREHFTQRWVQ